MKFSFDKISDNNLVAPALLTIFEEPEKKISTTKLLKNLRTKFILPINELKVLRGRKDDIFSQKVRNINSHKTLEKINLAYSKDKYISLSKEGIEVANLLSKKLEKYPIVNENIIESLSDYKNLLYRHSLKFPFNPIYLKKLTNFNFSVRAQNVFKQLKLIYIGDLVQISPSNISSYPNAGKKTLVEITNLLNELSLKLKTEINEWNKDNIDRYRKILYLEEKKSFKNDLDTLIKSALKKFSGKKTPQALGREQQIIYSRVGIDQEFLSLQEIGDKFKVTRERVRQISSRFLNKLKQNKEIKFQINKLGTFLRKTTPITEELLNKTLIKKNFFSSYKTFACLKNIIKLLGGTISFDVYVLRIRGENEEETENVPFLVSNKQEEKILDKILSLSRKYTRKFGYCNYSKLISDNFNFSVRVKLARIKDCFKDYKFFFWFDDDNYCALDTASGSVVNILRKLIYVNKKINYETLSEALLNNYRIKTSPPKNLLKKICVLHGFKCDEQYIYNDGSESTLSPLDTKLINMFKDNGPFLNFYQCIDLAEKYDIKSGSLFAFLYAGSIIKNLDDNVFCLFGTEIDPEKINEARKYFNKEKFKSELNLRCNWQNDGSILLEFNLSKILQLRGFLYLPSNFQQYLEGDYLIQYGSNLTNNKIKVSKCVIWNMNEILKNYKSGDNLKIKFSFDPNIAKFNE